jgi:protein-disulfide isomerase-like protein with CxxC motif
MSTPIDELRKKYSSHYDHLRAIENALIAQFNIPQDQWPQVRKAVQAAYDVGRRTTTTDDWCDS